MTSKESGLRDRFVKRFLKPIRVDSEKLADPELQAAAALVTPLVIVDWMFNYLKFSYKFEDEAMRMMLPEDTEYLIREFCGLGYRRCEGKFVMWTAGMRYEKSKSLKELKLAELAAMTMQQSLSIVRTNMVQIPERFKKVSPDEQPPVVLPNNFI